MAKSFATTAWEGYCTSTPGPRDRIDGAALRHRYGQSDSQLSQGDPDKVSPINPFRYSAKRADTGSSTLDMGVRRFGPDVSHFLTPDFFYGSLANLSLSVDPLTDNRYDLAGGNPISFAEWDGHMVLADGYGGAATTPSENPIRNIAQPTPTTTRDDQRQLPCSPSSLENFSEYEQCRPPTRPIPNIATSESNQKDGSAALRICGPALSFGGAFGVQSACRDFLAFARGGKGDGGGFRGRVAGFLAALGLGGGGGGAGQVAAKLTEKAAEQEAKNPDASDQATDLAVRNPLTQHASDQMAERDITQRMVDLAISRGSKFYDRLNGTFTYVLDQGFASGATLRVATNTLTGAVTTVIRQSRTFNPEVLLGEARRFIGL